MALHAVAEEDRNAGGALGPVDLMDPRWCETATEDDLHLLFPLGE